MRAKRRTQLKHMLGHGKVDLLYTYGSPSSGKPPMRNPTTSDGCFPGRRFWLSNHGNASFGRDQVDIIPPLPNIVGYSHPFMDGVELEYGERKYIHHPCSEENTGGPPGRGKLYLHDSVMYREEASKVDQLASDVSQVGLAVSYQQDEQEAARYVSSRGWSLVHTAFHPGGIVGGPQVTHLVQHPDSLVCMVTFQGTSSSADWLTDANAISVDFCGLEGQVHKGFRDHLRRIVKSDVFQTRIRPYLPSCSQVIAVGHSLGGAMAELFTGCMATAPAPGTPGWESDFQYFTWTQGRASRLKYVKVS